MSYADFDKETAADRARAKARQHAIGSGARGVDGLTEAERLLLAHLKRAGLAFSQRQDYPRFTLPSSAEYSYNEQQALPLGA